MIFSVIFKAWQLQKHNGGFLDPMISPQITANPTISHDSINQSDWMQNNFLRFPSDPE